VADRAGDEGEEPNPLRFCSAGAASGHAATILPRRPMKSRRLIRIPQAQAGASARLVPVPIENSVMTPAVVISPILLLWDSVNHSAPFGPTVIPCGPLPAVGMENSEKTPAVVRRPILLPASSVNHIAPSGPMTGEYGWLPAVGIENSEKAPLVVMRPILFALSSTNQSAPSGPP